MNLSTSCFCYGKSKENSRPISISVLAAVSWKFFVKWNKESQGGFIISATFFCIEKTITHTNLQTFHLFWIQLSCISARTTSVLPWSLFSDNFRFIRQGEKISESQRYWDLGHLVLNDAHSKKLSFTQFINKTHNFTHSIIKY